LSHKVVLSPQATRTPPTSGPARRLLVLELATSRVNFQFTSPSLISKTHLLRSLDSRELLLSNLIKMAPPEVHHLFHHPIADHSFSADKQTLAVARDTSVELYERTGNGFKLKDELKGHDKTVTSVDIALETGRIVTCSQGPFITRQIRIRL
jgi:hypothetical protein